MIKNAEIIRTILKFSNFRKHDEIQNLYYIDKDNLSKDTIDSLNNILNLFESDEVYHLPYFQLLITTDHHKDKKDIHVLLDTTIDIIKIDNDDRLINLENVNSYPLISDIETILLSKRVNGEKMFSVDITCCYEQYSDEQIIQLNFVYGGYKKPNFINKKSIIMIILNYLLNNEKQLLF